MTNGIENQENEIVEPDEFSPPNPFLIGLADGVHSIGFVIIAFFVINVLSQIFPLSLFNPVWLQKASTTLMMNGVTPLIGAVFILISPLANPVSIGLENRAWLVRRLATFAAIGYLLLIPIQAYAGLKLMSLEKQKQEDILGRVQEAAEDIRNSRTAGQLRAAYELIPGDKPILGDQFTQPVDVIRDQLLDQITPNIKRAEVAFSERIAQLWKDWIPVFAQNVFRLVVLFFGYASIAQDPNSSITLLEAVFMRFGKTRKPEESPIIENIPSEWLGEENDAGRDHVGT